MQIPKVKKLVLNVGLGGRALRVPERSVAQNLLVLKCLTKQKAKITYSKKSIDKFKLRKNLALGCQVSLTKKKSWEDFLDHLVFSYFLPNASEVSLEKPQLSSFDEFVADPFELSGESKKGGVPRWDGGQDELEFRKQGQRYKFSTGFGFEDYFMLERVPYDLFKGCRSDGFEITFVIEASHLKHLSGYLSGWLLLDGLLLPYNIDR